MLVDDSGQPLTRFEVETLRRFDSDADEVFGDGSGEVLPPFDPTVERTAGPGVEGDG